MTIRYGTSKRPIILGIVGDSATGKTTLSQGIVKILGTENVSVLCTDDYHRLIGNSGRNWALPP